MQTLPSVRCPSFPSLGFNGIGHLVFSKTHDLMSSWCYFCLISHSSELSFDHIVHVFIIYNIFNIYIIIYIIYYCSVSFLSVFSSEVTLPDHLSPCNKLGSASLYFMTGGFKVCWSFDFAPSSWQTSLSFPFALLLSFTLAPLDARARLAAVFAFRIEYDRQIPEDVAVNLPT